MLNGTLEVKQLLQITMHTDRDSEKDRPYITEGFFTFPVWVDSKNVEDLVFLQHMLEMLPSKIDIWYEEEE